MQEGWEGYCHSTFKAAYLLYLHWHGVRERGGECWQGMTDLKGLVKEPACS